MDFGAVVYRAAGRISRGRAVDLFVVLRDHVPRVLPDFWGAESTRGAGEDSGGCCGGFRGGQYFFHAACECVPESLWRGAGHVWIRAWLQGGGGEICGGADGHR